MFKRVRIFLITIYNENLIQPFKFCIKTSFYKFIFYNEFIIL